MRYIFALITLSLAACSSMPPIALQSGEINHVVLVWLKTPGKDEHRADLLARAKELTAIPGVLSVEGGVVVPSTRSTVDSTFDVGFVIRMRDQDTLNSYANNPIHQKLVKEVLLPVTSQYLIYDIKTP